MREILMAASLEVRASPACGGHSTVPNSQGGTPNGSFSERDSMNTASDRMVAASSSPSQAGQTPLRPAAMETITSARVGPP